MPTAKKEATVEELTDLFQNSTILISAQYRGMSVAEMVELRRSMKKNGARLRVVKNTLAKLAADRAGISGFVEGFDGPTAVAAGADDPTAPAKALADHAKAHPQTTLTVVGGILNGEVIDKSQVEALAKIPSREELIAKLMGSLNAPLVGLVSVLGGPMRALANVLQARKDQIASQGE